MTHALSVTKLSSGYGKLTVVSDVSFDLVRGTTCGILGPNGAGKSTLLKAIAGLLPASSGCISIYGAPVQHLPAYRRARAGISLVPEGRQIFGGLMVEENLRVALNARAASNSISVTQALDEIFALFPILDVCRRQVGASLSGGQQQMLAIARALLAAPRVLMLDEPTQGLAPVVVAELQKTLIALKPRFSIVVVEQNRDFIEHLADTQLRMGGGRLEPLTN